MWGVLYVFAEKLTFRDVKSPQEFRHGETAEVVCDVISSPVPAVVWYYQDIEITEEHHSKLLSLSISIVFSFTIFCSKTGGFHTIWEQAYFKMLHSVCIC